MEERVILVDEEDNEVGTEEKIKAHREALLHRAFSIFVFNSKGEMMLQQRAKEKYHCGGLWSTAACSHPRKGESVEEGAHRKLQQEMGFDVPLTRLFSFIYKAPLDNGLTEHELDYVLIGHYDQDPVFNPEEAMAFKWIAPEKLQEDVQNNPDNYTPWFKIVLDRVIEY